MNTIYKSDRLATVPSGVGDAVGMEKSQWFVAVVKHNTEKSCAEKMRKIGYNVYVPVQEEYRIWRNGRKVKVERVVIPSTVFIKCTEPERREVVKLPFINRFMTNKAGSSSDGIRKPLAVIPDTQMETLKFMLNQSDSPVEFIDRIYQPGDNVRIIRGNLKGLEGVVMDMKNAKSEFLVSINIFGYARLIIDTVNIIKI